MAPGFENFPTGLLLGALTLIFFAQLLGAYLTRDRSAWSLLVLTGAAGVLHQPFVDACLPAVLGGAAAAPPDPRLHGWLAMLTGHAILYLGNLEAQPGDTLPDHIRRLRLPIMLGVGLLFFAFSPLIESRLAGSLVLSFHAGLIFVVTYAAAMQRRFAEGMRPAVYLIAGLLVLAIGTPLVVWLVRRSHVPFDAHLLTALVLVIHLLLLGVATLAEPVDRLRRHIRELEANAEAAAAALVRAAELEEENRQVETRYHQRAAEIAALTQDLENHRLQLDSAQRRLAGLAEECPDPLLTFDGKTRQILEANARAEEFFGSSRDELRGRLLERLLAGTDTEAAARRLYEAPSGEVMPDPVEFLRPDGTAVPVEVTPIVVRTRDRHFVHFWLRDLSALEAARNEARRFKARLDALVELQDAAVVAAANGRLLIWNNGASNATRLSAADAHAIGPAAALGRLAGEGSAAALQRLTQAAANGRRPLSEFHRLVDGRPWRVTASRLRDPAGDGWFLVAIATT